MIISKFILFIAQLMPFSVGIISKFVCFQFFFFFLWSRCLWEFVESMFNNFQNQNKSAINFNHGQKHLITSKCGAPLLPLFFRNNRIDKNEIKSHHQPKCSHCYFRNGWLVEFWTKRHIPNVKINLEITNYCTVQKDHVTWMKMKHDYVTDGFTGKHFDISIINGRRQR